MLGDNILKVRHNRFGNTFDKPTIIEEQTYEIIDFKDSLKSIKIPELYFTNFFTSNKCQRYDYFKELYSKYKNNANIFNDLLIGDEIQDSNKEKLNRLCSIMSNANNNESITIQNLVQNILKFKFKKEVTMQLYIKKEGNICHVYLVDLYHLGIPATNQITGRSDYKKVYQKRQKADCCLSNIKKETL